MVRLQLGEYYFNSSSYSSGFVNLVTNSIPIIKQPSASGYSSSSDVNITDKGAYITENKFLTLDNNFTSTNNIYITSGIWIYYIQGAMGELLNFHANLVVRSVYTNVIFYHNSSTDDFEIYVDHPNKQFNTTK